MDETLKHLKEILNGVQEILDKLFPRTAKIDAPEYLTDALALDANKLMKDALTNPAGKQSSSAGQLQAEHLKAKEDQNAAEEQNAAAEIQTILTRCNADYAKLSKFQKVQCIRLQLANEHCDASDSEVKKKLCTELKKKLRQEEYGRGGGAIRKKNSVKRSRKFVRKQRAATKRHVFRFSKSRRKLQKN